MGQIYGNGRGRRHGQNGHEEKARNSMRRVTNTFLEKVFRLKVMMSFDENVRFVEWRRRRSYSSMSSKEICAIRMKDTRI